MLKQSKEERLLMTPVDPNNIQALVAEVEKQYKEKLIHAGSESQRIPRIPFTSLELNIATGGGVPLGRISRHFGNYSSGKTLNCLNLIKNAQNLNLIAEQYLESEYDVVKRRGEDLLTRFPNGLECAYYNVEKVWDKEHAKNVGVDTDRVFVVEGSKIEPMGTILEAALGSIHLHVIDSVSAAASVDELDSEIEDWHRAIKARVWSKVLDHWQEHIDHTDNAIVLIDQVRIDQMTGAQMAPGGEKLEHASSQTIHFKRGKWLYDRGGVLKAEAPQKDDTIHGGAEADGYEVIASVRKSRVGRPFRKARLQIRLNPGPTRFDQEYELPKAASWFNIVEKNGSWFTLPSGEKVQGENGLLQALNEDVDLKKQVLDATEKHIYENP